MEKVDSWRMEKVDAIGRLTEREKLCLRQWLQHKSAKEIATDLGISHHSVEKRLKMARIKLGVTSSLHAARMLEEVEGGYGQTVPHSAGLSSLTARGQSTFSRRLIFGAITMSLFAAALFALVMQPTGSASTSPDKEAAAREYDQQLDFALDRLIAAAQIDSDGEIFLHLPVGDQRFLEPHSGFYWQISGNGHEDFRSNSLWNRRLRVGDHEAATEVFHYNSAEFPSEPLRIAERTIRLPGSDVKWHFIVARSLSPRG